VVAAILACALLALVLTLRGSRRDQIVLTVTGKQHLPAKTIRPRGHHPREIWKVRITDRTGNSAWLHVTPQQYRAARVGHDYDAG